LLLSTRIASSALASVAMMHPPIAGVFFSLAYNTNVRPRIGSDNPVTTHSYELGSRSQGTHRRRQGGPFRSYPARQHRRTWTGSLAGARAPGARRPNTTFGAWQGEKASVARRSRSKAGAPLCNHQLLASRRRSRVADAARCMRRTDYRTRGSASKRSGLSRLDRGDLCRCFQSQPSMVLAPSANTDRSDADQSLRFSYRWSRAVVGSHCVRRSHRGSGRTSSTQHRDPRIGLLVRAPATARGGSTVRDETPQ
jgi:hypothetical protein